MAIVAYRLQAEQVAAFKQNGYVNGGALLSADEVEVLRGEIERVVEQRERTDIPQPYQQMNISKDESTPVWQIVNIWMASHPFQELVTNPALGQAAQALLAAQEIRLWHDQIQYKPAKVGGINMWHQDAPYWPSIEPATQVTAWVALDDVDDDNGCMSMVPGSHLWGNQQKFLAALKDDYEAMPEEFAGNPIQVCRAPVKKGEVHFHHALTWHGSHMNTSGRPRRAIAIHFMSEKTVYAAGGHHLIKPLITVADGEKLTGEFFPKVAG